MTRSSFRLAVVAVIGLIAAAPAIAGTSPPRQQFLEPLAPDRPAVKNSAEASGQTRCRKTADPTKPDCNKPTAQLCYCRTVTEKNSFGQRKWKLVCSDTKPSGAAQMVRANNCRAITRLPAQ